MKKSKAVILSSILTFIVTVLLCIVFVVPLFMNFGYDDAALEVAGKISEINELLSEKSIYTLDTGAASQNALYAYVATLDDAYASYYERSEYEEYLDGVKGKHVGIGVNISVPSSGYIDDEGIYVIRAVGGSPAESAGLKAGDRIIEVDGEKVVGLDYYDVVDRFLGEVGTVLELKVVSGGEEYSLSVTRETYEARDIDWKMLDGNVGFIRIHEFNSQTAYTQFKKAMETLISQGAKGFVFDVRNNPGGDYSAVVNMLNLLVDKDELVILSYKDEEYVEYSTGRKITDLPSVVMINGSSASAAELFASALRDLNSAPLVGTTSYGKGVGQEYGALSDGSGIKFTTFTYTTKSRVNYDGVGLVPDYTVESSENIYALSEDEDVQLSKAKEVLKSLQ